MVNYLYFKRLVVEGDTRVPRILRHIELIDDEAAEYGIKVVKCSDRLMAKKHGFRSPPGISYFRKSKYINYDGQLMKITLLRIRIKEYKL